MYTQEQLEVMDDFHINETVFNEFFKNRGGGPDYIQDEKSSSLYLVGINTYLGAHGVPDEREEKYGELDYCNNWADMGPLIKELSKLGTIVINDGFGLIPQPLAQMICSAGQTLRAAAIVYILVMQERNQ